jgi:hypothetical protein
MATRLAPTVSPDTEFFWNGLRDHKLLIQRCTRCQVLRQPPRPDVSGVQLTRLGHEGVRLVSNLREIAPGDVEVGIPLRSSTRRQRGAPCTRKEGDGHHNVSHNDPGLA